MLKILLIEDSTILCERLGALINAIPNALIVAQTDNEDEALSRLELYRPDIAIIDLRLKCGSGLSVIQHINVTHPKITMIVLTNFAQPEYRARCMALGAHHFFDKTKGCEACIKLLTELCKNSSVPFAHVLQNTQTHRENTTSLTTGV